MSKAYPNRYNNISDNEHMVGDLAGQLDEGKGLARTVADIKDANKRGALHFAAREGQTEVCKYLLEELKLDVDSKDEEGEIELLKILLSKVVDVDSQSDAGTPLIWAAGHGQPEAVKVLLEHHANALLMMLDSRLNKSGGLQAVYVRTEKGVLIEVKPHARLPRTFKRFSVQVLQKLSTSAVGKREKLLRVIKNPVSRYLPVNSRKIGFSFSSEKLVDINKYVASASSDTDLVFVVGAMAHGKIDKEYAMILYQFLVTL
ncbi:ribosomal rna small subunit methyltransferase nep1 [Quercus suber]|uniref:Ribosomal rna small subunit methyltransferase nep1 n=1 Tax=Quercus suber TaxID=58331 RepID=A0AAW0JDR5_QUESU